MNGRRKRTRIDGQFAARDIKMLESHAFRELSLSARRVLDRLEIELAHHGGMDNGKLPVTYDDFQRYGIDRHAIAPAIRARSVGVCSGRSAKEARRSISPTRSEKGPVGDQCKAKCKSLLPGEA